MMTATRSMSAKMLVLAACVVLCATAVNAATLSTVPAEVVSSGGQLDLVLEVAEHRITGSNQPVWFNTRSYNGSATGPVWKFKAGDHISLTLINSLGPESEDAITEMNTFRYPNVTNMHTHGLHVSSQGIADNVFRHADPGDTLQYEYDIPSNHYPGTHWYHAHVHGSTNMQVMGGLAGVLIVEDDPATAPAELLAMDDFPVLIGRRTFTADGIVNEFLNYELASEVTQSTMDLDLDTTSSGLDTLDYHVINGVYQPTLTVQPKEWARLRLVNADPGAYVHAVVSSGCEMALLAKDGVYVSAPYTGSPTVILAPGSRRDVAVKCAAAGSYTLDCSTAVLGEGASATGPPTAGGVGDVCKGTLMHIVAAGSDATTATSLPSSFAPRPSYLGDLRSSTVDGGTFSFQMTGDSWPAVIIDYVPIYASAVIVGLLLLLHLALVFAGVYSRLRCPTLLSGCKRPQAPASFPVEPEGVELVEQGEAVGPSAGASAGSGEGRHKAPVAAKRSKAGQLVNWPCVVVLLVAMGLLFLWIQLASMYEYGGFAINNTRFTGEEDFMTTMELGKVQEWEIGGGAGGFAHPGHVHINHMQIQAISGGLTESMGWRVGDWYDVIPELEGAATTVRFLTDTFTGTVVCHCHILAHEDLGMMAVVNIE